MNNLHKINRLYLTLALAMLFVLSSTGCTKDRQGMPVAEMFEAPKARQLSADPIGSVETPTQRGAIQQTSYESQVKNADPTWHVSLPAAIAEAQAEGKLILADFTGSDWCPHCVTLKKKIFNTPQFKSWASDNVALLELDYPKRSQLPSEIRQQNETLKSRYKISSYPTVLLLDVQGNVKGKLDYRSGQSPAQWVKMADTRLQQGSAPSSIRR